MRPSLLIHGSAARLCSFTLVNRRLAAGLEQRGWRVSLVACDDHARGAQPPLTRPDVYLFFGFPFDLVSAPGRVNAFFLSYDYATFTYADRDLSRRLNSLFDLVIVPSRSAAEACRRSGVTRPLIYCPLGVDTGEFHPPSAAAVAQGSREPFEFLALGGAYERKGTDILLRAYRKAFRDDDPVRLVIKAFSYDHLLPWVEARLVPFERRGAPSIVFEHGEVRSVAPYYRRADAGVFPYRGEGFALTVLECLASGTPVIATRGCAPLDYARDGVSWLPATPVRRRGRDELEPGLEALAAAMRQAVAGGRPSAADRRRIAGSVREWTWRRTIDTLDETLRTWLRASSVPRARRSPPAATRRGEPRAARHVAYAYHGTGVTSWKKVARHVRHALASRAERLSAYGWRDGVPDGHADITVGQSDFALEAFQASIARRPDARRVLYRESAPLPVMVGISDRERRTCGAAPHRTSPMAVWRSEMERRLADRIIVPSRRTRAEFLAAGCRPDIVRVVPMGITPASRLPVRRRATLRVLFSATDPFRKGVRTLFAAWRLAAMGRAELLCVTSKDLLTSRRLLASVVADPSIRLLPFLPPRRFLALYETVDCVVLPSFEDGFSFDIADAIARGLPTIVSDRAGIHELMTDGQDGWVVPAGRPEALARALQDMAASHRRRAAIGRAAFETARRWSWRRFETAFAAAVFE